MDRDLLRVALIGVLAAAMVACGATPPSAVTPVAGGPTGVPGGRPTAPLAGAPTTITLEPGNADGPGVTISDAIANAAIGPQLVNGTLLRALDGSVWLCEGIPTSPQPQCVEPHLLVVGGARGPDLRKG